MKKAFTLLELIFVFVVIGILAAVILPRLDREPIREVAIQLLSHIRYTQHLAMVDDKYDISDVNWYKKRWQIKFSRTVGSDSEWAYAVFWDRTVDGNPNATETAVNPVDQNKKLTGGYSAGTIAYGDSDATEELNLGHKYGITNIAMTGGCNITNDGAKRLAFDHLGRPIAGPLHTATVTGPYRFTTGATTKLIQNTCNIVLSTPNDSVTIAIEPETGYSHIL